MIASETHYHHWPRALYCRSVRPAVERRLMYQRTHPQAPSAAERHPAYCPAFLFVQARSQRLFFRRRPARCRCETITVPQHRLSCLCEETGGTSPLICPTPQAGGIPALRAFRLFRLSSSGWLPSR